MQLYNALLQGEVLADYVQMRLHKMVTAGRERIKSGFIYQ